ncbi:hypothetical protein BD779DRAFT_1610541 [Infundibulicybe gibba]|nr:hypothetical protein BD779DRAFT_1610541 [Infundibulicybe gibba]
MMLIFLQTLALCFLPLLFIHLIFTAQYHWPLAPVNYVLQLSGVTTLLISLIATLHVVLSATIAESLKWPYMLSYIAVNVPPWRATWLVMNASTSGLIQVRLMFATLWVESQPCQITHIQFLTLLYPSRLEGRLIFTLLGPMAIVAAVMQLVPINGGLRHSQCCNATLSLLFTASLFIWGLLVNRTEAWRTDGGTAAFGCAALVLALVSTALNFLYVPREEEYVWLPGLMWAVVLWQSFLGWWWWVGAGSGGGREDEIEEKRRREAKRESRRRNTQERRQETRDKAKKVWQGVASAFGNREGSKSFEGEEVLKFDTPESTVSTTSTTSSGTLSTLPRMLPAIVHRWYASLRHAHLSAARQQAVERVERFKELERGGIESQRRGIGWGLGSFAWRASREEADRLEATTCPPIHTPPAIPVERPKSMWWWGPLRRWRLQDSTVY